MVRFADIEGLSIPLARDSGAPVLTSGFCQPFDETKRASLFGSNGAKLTAWFAIDGARRRWPKQIEMRLVFGDYLSFQKPDLEPDFDFDENGPS